MILFCGFESATIEGFIFLFERCVGFIVPQGARDHEVGAVAIAGDGDIVDAALAQKHLYVGFVWLWVEVVDEEYGHVDFFADDHGGDLGVTAHGTGMHAGDVACHAVGFECVTDQRTGCARAHEFV